MLPAKEYFCAVEELRALVWGYSLPVIGRIYQRRLELALDLCTGGERVLEIGFGPGFLFPNLNEIYHEIHGIDLEADADSVARVFDQRGITTYLKDGTALSLPYPDAHFDTVIAMSILEHLHPEENLVAAAEIARVLRPQGQLIYGVPVERPLMNFIFRYVFRRDIGQYHFSTELDVRSAAEQFLTPVQHIDMRPLPFLGSIYEIGHLKK